MGKISFELVNEREEIIYVSDSLAKVYQYCKTRYNKESEEDWYINELDNGEYFDCANVAYVLDVYQTESTLPETVSDIPNY